MWQFGCLVAEHGREPANWNITLPSGRKVYDPLWDTSFHDAHGKTRTGHIFLEQNSIIFEPVVFICRNRDIKQCVSTSTGYGVRLHADARGIRFSIPAPASSPAADVAQDVRRGAYGGVSIEFRVKLGEVEPGGGPNGLDALVVSRALVSEIGPVRRPAFAQSSIAVVAVEIAA